MAQSVSVIEVGGDKHVDNLKRKIKKKWPMERGVEMFPVDSVSAYFLEGSPMDCENCIDIAVYLKKE
ncbi:unnamed protein product [Rhizophagus irregularis]|nr:unnamed protein product [Rhizophagus irregularis]